MSEWKETTLADLCSDISYGYTESAKQEKIGPKFLRITDIASERLEWSNVPYCSISESDFEKYKLLPGDIVIARTGATTGVNYTIKESDPKEVVFASYLIRYKINPKIASPYFIGQLLRSSYWSDYVDAIVGGSAQPGANAKQLGLFEFLLPPIDIQKTIASILSCLDDKIDLLHRQNATLEKIAETLFRQWFIEEAKEREKTKIGLVLETVLGGTPSTKKPEYWDGTIPWINSGEVNNFRILKPTKFITELGLAESNTKLLPIGTTVLAITGATLGQISLLEISTCANQSVVGIIPNETYPKEYVFLWIKYMIDEIILNETGGAQPHINKNDVNETEILVPCNDDLEFIESKIKPLFKKISINSFQINTLIELRDSLLPKLMSGEITVNQG